MSNLTCTGQITAGTGNITNLTATSLTYTSANISGALNMTTSGPPAIVINCTSGGNNAVMNFKNSVNQPSEYYVLGILGSTNNFIIGNNNALGVQMGYGAHIIIMDNIFRPEREEKCKKN